MVHLLFGCGPQGGEVVVLENNNLYSECKCSKASWVFDTTMLWILQCFILLGLSDPTRQSGVGSDAADSKQEQIHQAIKKFQVCNLSPFLPRRAEIELASPVYLLCLGTDYNWMLSCRWFSLMFSFGRSAHSGSRGSASLLLKNMSTSITNPERIDVTFQWQRMAVTVLSTAEGDHSQKEVTSLLSVIGQMAAELDFSSEQFTQVQAWVQKLCSEQQIGEREQECKLC